MASTIVFSIGPFSKTWAISDTDLNRLVAALHQRFGAGMTNQQLFDAMTAALATDWRKLVLDYEQAQAEAAIPSMQSITLT